MPKQTQSGKCECTTAKILLARVRAVLNDGASNCAGDTSNFTHWDDSTLLSSLSEAIDLMVSLRPDAFSETAEIELKPGAQQRIPCGYDALIDVVANSDGSGNATTPLVKVSDDFTRVAPAKCTADSTAPYEATGFHQYPQSQVEFGVSPPVPSSGATVVARMVKIPDPICTVSDCVPVPRKLHASLVNWVIFRAYSKDIESAFAGAMAQRHYGWFYEGIEYQRLAESRFGSGYYLGMIGNEDPQARSR